MAHELFHTLSSGQQLLPAEVAIRFVDDGLDEAVVARLEANRIVHVTLLCISEGFQYDKIGGRNQ